MQAFGQLPLGQPFFTAQAPDQHPYFFAIHPGSLLPLNSITGQPPRRNKRIVENTAAGAKQKALCRGTGLAVMHTYSARVTLPERRQRVQA